MQISFLAEETMNIETITLDELKTELENKTDFRFTKGISVLDEEVLFLNDLPKKCRITIGFGRYRTYDEKNGKRAIDVSGDDRRDGFSGFGCYWDSLEQVVRAIEQHAPRCGWKKPVGEQLKLF